VAYKNRYGVDGIMIGRAAIGYPWIFDEIKHFVKTGERLPPPTIQQRVEVIRQHLHRSVQWKGPIVRHQRDAQALYQLPERVAQYQRIQAAFSNPSRSGSYRRGAG
jgi:tRNA-dihydrouridine synthase